MYFTLLFSRLIWLPCSEPCRVAPHPRVLTTTTTTPSISSHCVGVDLFEQQTLSVTRVRGLGLTLSAFGRRVAYAADQPGDMPGDSGPFRGGFGVLGRAISHILVGIHTSKPFSYPCALLFAVGR